MGKVMEELLIKAQRDKSKLVQVQRSVSRNGKTFMQNFWVQPSQVKASDKVIGGQQNLLPKAGSVPKPAAGVLDKAYFESIKSDRTKAIDYLKSCGVQWNDHSHAGINWMRAMQAYNAAVGNQNGGKTASTTPTQPTSQATTQTAQVAQNPQGKGVTLTAAQQAEVDAGKNGKEKVVILKKLLGKDGCMEYAKQLGVTWDEHSMDAINNMRMSMALSKHFDTIDGTVSPIGGKGSKNGGGSKDNQNAKKDEVKKDDDTIKVSPSHTPRQVTLIGLINGITDPKELELIKSTGIVAEDADAKAFIEKTLKPAYYKKGNAATRNVYRGADGFSKTAVDTVGTVLKLPKRLVTKAVANLADDSNGINMAVVQHPREIIPAFGSGGRGQRSVGDPEASHHYQGNGLVSILGELGGFSQFSTDEFKSNKGYNGNDLAQIEAQYQKFGVDAYGVVSVLKHISEKDPSVKAEADTMTSQYLDMLDICNHDVTMLQTVLSNKYSYLHDYVVRSSEEKSKFDTVARCLRDLQAKYNLTSEDMAETVYLMHGGYYKNGKEVGYLVRADGSPVLDTKGYKVSIKDCIYAASGDNDLADWFSNDDRLQFLETMVRHDKTYDTLTEAEHRDYISSHSYYGWSYSNPFVTRETSKRFESLTEDKYNQVRNTYLKFAGQKIQRYDTVSDSYVDVDTSSWGASEWETFDEKANEYVSSWGSKRDFIMMPDGDNSEKDTILANFHSIAAHQSMMDGIADDVPDRCPPSKANDQGNDLSKNFSYLSSRMTEHGRMYWAQGAQLSGDQINAQILSQLKNAPVITSDMRGRLMDYSEKHGVDTNYGGSTVSASRVRLNKAGSLNMSYNSISDYQDTPMMEIFAEQMLSIAHCSPQILNSRVKTQDDVDTLVSSKIGYVPFGTAVQSSSVSGLKQLREQAFAKVHCSLRTADQTQRDTIETRVKQDWDKGKRSSSGRRLYGNISFVGHGVYQIQNSEADEIFRESVKKTGEKPQSFFHGTSFQGACGIVGVDGKFRAPKDSADAAKQGLKYAGGMLGPGVYLADLAGKSAGYFGTWGSGYAHGALLVCDAILGKHATASDYSSVKTRMDVDSVSMKAGTNTGRTVLRADEWCVRRNDYVSPQFIVDAEAIPR